MVKSKQPLNVTVSYIARVCSLVLYARAYRKLRGDVTNAKKYVTRAYNLTTGVYGTHPAMNTALAGLWIMLGLEVCELYETMRDINRISYRNMTQAAKFRLPSKLLDADGRGSYSTTWTIAELLNNLCEIEYRTFIDCRVQVVLSNFTPRNTPRIVIDGYQHVDPLTCTHRVNMKSGKIEKIYTLRALDQSGLFECQKISKKHTVTFFFEGIDLTEKDIKSMECASVSLEISSNTPFGIPTKEYCRVSKHACSLFSAEDWYSVLDFYGDDFYVLYSGTSLCTRLAAKSLRETNCSFSTDEYATFPVVSNNCVLPHVFDLEYYKGMIKFMVGEKATWMCPTCCTPFLPQDLRRLADI